MKYLSTALSVLLLIAHIGAISEQNHQRGKTFLSSPEEALSPSFMYPQSKAKSLLTAIA
jgi:hypothetical protein